MAEQRDGTMQEKLQVAGDMQETVSLSGMQQEKLSTSGTMQEKLTLQGQADAALASAEPIHTESDVALTTESGETLMTEV